MSTNANVYPTGIEGIYGRHRDTNNDNTEQWQHDNAQHDLTDAEHSCLQRNTTTVTTRTSTVLQLGRATSASSAERVSTQDPRVHPSDRYALGAAAVSGISADGGLAASAASDCGGARFAGRRSLTSQLDNSESLMRCPTPERVGWLLGATPRNPAVLHPAADHLLC